MSEISLPQKFETHPRAHPASYSMYSGFRLPSPVTGRAAVGRQVDLSPPSSSEVRNEWSRKRLRGVGRDGCNFSLIGTMRFESVDFSD